MLRVPYHAWHCRGYHRVLTTYHNSADKIHLEISISSVIPFPTFANASRRRHDAAPLSRPLPRRVRHVAALGGRSTNCGRPVRSPSGRRTSSGPAAFVPRRSSASTDGELRARATDVGFRITCCCVQAVLLLLRLLWVRGRPRITVRRARRVCSVSEGPSDETGDADVRIRRDRRLRLLVDY